MKPQVSSLLSLHTICTAAKIQLMLQLEVVALVLPPLQQDLWTSAWISREHNMDSVCFLEVEHMLLPAIGLS